MGRTKLIYKDHFELVSYFKKLLYIKSEDANWFFIPFDESFDKITKGLLWEILGQKNSIDVFHLTFKFL